MHTTARTKLFSGLLAIAVACACGAMPASAASMAEVNGWLASTNKVMRVAPPPGMHPDGAAEYVQVAGSDGAGWVIPRTAGHGFLANGQEVMIVPLVSGGSGGVFQALLFTRIGGRTRFVGIVPSADGHLDVTVARGVLVVRTPVYKAGDANCCPSAIHYERDTLRGIRLVTLTAYDAKR